MMRKLFQTRCPVALWALLLVCILCAACADQSYSSPLGYQMHRPVRRDLGKSLNEISGLFFVPGEDALLAIADNKRNIFRIGLRAQKLTDKVKNFYEQQDFEDVVQVGQAIFVLISDGSIVEVPLDMPDSVNVYRLNAPGRNDFETLYFDPSAKGLIMLCKTCASDEGKGIRSAYRFALPQRQFDMAPYYTISTEKIKAAFRDDNADFKPSAAAIHPIDKRLYILASAGQLLVIANRQGQVQEAYRLNIDQHPQAEGIAFAPNGAMYISNEGKYGAATLQMYSYKRSASLRAAKTTRQ